MAKGIVSIKRWRRKFGQEGMALLEFALVLPVLLLMMLGILDFGRAVYYLNTMEHAAREGARVGIVCQNSDWDIDGNQPTVYTTLQPYAGTNTVVGRVTDALVGMDLNKTSVTLSAAQGTGRGQSLPFTVQIQYTYQPATALIGIPSIPLTAESTMIIE